jgi:hypothetical protein
MAIAFVTKAERTGEAAASAVASVTLANASWLGAAVLLFFTATVTAAAILFPLVQWDMIAYVATILEKTVSDPQLLHEQVYRTVQGAVSHGEFLVLTEDRPYRAVQYSDPAAFYSMLGFYRVKWLYIEAISAMAQFLPPVSAIRAVSAISAAGVGLTVLAWLAWAGRLSWAPLAMAVLMVTGYGYVARLATPDIFASLLFFIGVLAYLRRFEPLVAIGLFCSFLARPDHLAFLGIFMVMTAYMRPFSFGAVVAFFAGAIAYVPLTAGADHPGWWVQLWFTDIEYVPTIEGFHPPFSILVYCEAVLRSIVRSLVEETWLGMLIIALFGWLAMIWADIRVGQREKVVLVTVLLSIAAKFVIVPLHETRFHFAYVVAFALALIGSLPVRAGDGRPAEPSIPLH